ncbi:unnamed protein product [Trichogramma brassicae]|uniref:Reverse transcriptase domain-containing protein n=1 Tax=Trichogramma brassicae TaxID=86971 RepID=A0A6H5IPC3_9HYME|nr:unnamed protein product [Trichogramma brassicae]
MSRLRGPRANTPSSPILVRRIVAALFPRVPDEPGLPPPLQAGAIVPAVNLEELRRACGRIKDHTAPGPDGVPNFANKIAIATHPDIFLQVYTAFLQTGVFPACWIWQRLVKARQAPRRTIVVQAALYAGHSGQDSRKNHLRPPRSHY